MRPYAVHRPKLPLPRVEVYRDRKDRFRYRIRAKNGQVVATAGQSYADRSGARRAARREFTSTPVISLPRTRWGL